jgi:hypothetical protein
VPVRIPPTSTRTSRRNNPNAPLIRTTAPSFDQPARPSRNARVLDDLDAGEPAAGHADADDAAGHHGAAVRRPDHPAGGHRPGRVVAEGFGHGEQGVRVEQRVRVDHRDERLPGGVEAGVDRLGLAGVVLAHDHQPRPPVAGHGDRAHGRGDRHVVRQRPVHLDQVERLL